MNEQMIGIMDLISICVILVSATIMVIKLHTELKTNHNSVKTKSNL